MKNIRNTSDGEVEEHFLLIATRVPPGDRWQLELTPSEPPIEGIAQTLTAHFRLTKEAGSYRLDPRAGNLYLIRSVKVTPEEKPKEVWDIYGEY